MLQLGDEHGEFYEVVVAFMIVGLKSNIPYIIKTCPEIHIGGNWLKTEISSCLSILQDNGFIVRGIVCDIYNCFIIDAVAQGFSILDVCSNAISESGIPEYLLLNAINLQNMLSMCSKHKNPLFLRIARIISNVFFNNQRKRVNESIVKDRVSYFKKIKRQK